MRGDSIAQIGFSIDGSRSTHDRRPRSNCRAGLHRHPPAVAAGIFDVPTAENYLRQGVTSIIEGPDGSSPHPIKPFGKGRAPRA